MKVYIVKILGITESEKDTIFGVYDSVEMAQEGFDRAKFDWPIGHQIEIVAVEMNQHDCFEEIY
ncbi:MAG: DUF7336 domain-containing protein [bacterium]|jgi:hypothetical protein